LRQLETKVISADAFLFRPQTATRVRWDMNTDTPLPPDEPGGENPPDGAVIDYYLGSAPAGAVTLEIRDAGGQIVRRYSSADPIPAIDPLLAVPTYWVRPPQGLSSVKGMHRFLWDMHYPPVPGEKPSYPIAAVYRNTAPDFTSPWVMPGKYTVALNVNGKTYTQALIVQMDPRVKTPARDLDEQFRLSKQLYDTWVAFNLITSQSNPLSKQLADLRTTAKTDEVKTQIDAFVQKVNALVGAEVARPDLANKLTAASALARIKTLFGILQDVDVAPTPQTIAAVTQVQADARSLRTSWQTLTTQDIVTLNQQLRAAGLTPIGLEEPK
jgi:hypothetical protein